MAFSPPPAPWRVPLRQRRAPVVEPVVELNRIRVRDNGEPLVDALARVPEAVVHPDRLDYRKTSPHRFHGRAAVVEMLARAQAALPRGYRLMLWGIYRSLEDQIKIYTEVYEGFKKAHPHWPHNVLRRQTNRFVHPPDIKTPPGHSTGGAVDLSLVGPDGQPLNMTAPYDAQSEERRKVAATFSPLLGVEARAHRALLIRAMDAAGFSNYAGEWWHWSYGDSCWAWRVGRKAACYGPVAPPGEDETSPAPTGRGRHPKR